MSKRKGILLFFLISVVLFVVNANGAMETTSQYEDLYPIKVGKDSYGYINAHGDLRIPAKYINAYAFENGIAPVRDKNKQWSCIDTEGNTLFTLDVDHISPFSEGLAVVSIKVPGSAFPKQGYIDRTGSFVLEPLYSQATSFQEGLAAVSMHSDIEAGQDMGANTRFFINKKGEDVFKTRFNTVSDFVGDYAYVRIGFGENTTYIGYIDKKGDVLDIPKEYEQAHSTFSDGYIRLLKDEQYYFWNPKTDELIAVEEGYSAWQISEGAYFVEDKSTGLRGLKSKDGEWLIPCVYTRLGTKKEGLVTYQDDEGFVGFLNEHGDVVIEAQFLDLRPFAENLAQFSPRNGFDGGYITKNGTIFYGRDYVDENNF